MGFRTRPGFSLPGADESLQGANVDVPSRISFWEPTAFRLQGPARGHSLPFASIASSNIELGHPGSTPSQKREAATGLEFPLQYCYLTKTKCPELTGLGVRAKKLFGLKNINVYALGIYVDPVGVRKALASRYKGQVKGSLADNQQLYDDVIASEGYEMSLRLVISFGHLRRQQFVDALQERIKPLLEKAGDAKSMDVFSTQFDGVEFKKGLEITFVHTGKGQLVTQIGGEKRGVIESPALVRSLFEVYLGSDPVSKDAKQSFGTNLASVLKD